MKKVITYGTYDLFHFGHERLLERAKALGDYLIVGVTTDDFDRKRGKINVEQSLMERVESVRATGLADEIIIEEYEGQKIDDIKRYDIDIFTVGSDWVGKFDYLNEFCEVVYLDRTKGVSSTELRTDELNFKFGIVGETHIATKFYRESKYVNGIQLTGICSKEKDHLASFEGEGLLLTDNFEELLEEVDAIFDISHPSKHYRHIKTALNKGKHVLCEAPIALDPDQAKELFDLAREKNLILMDSIKTAYSTAYNRLLVLIQSGKIGEVLSVDATCTSLEVIPDQIEDYRWNSITAWAPTALLPIFQILGTDYKDIKINSLLARDDYDQFSKIDLTYDHAVASVKVGKGVKSEGELIVSGTEGYVYVPAPWWETDYFELRYENLEENKKYFYQLDGEGIRYELVVFAKAIQMSKANAYIKEEETIATSKIMKEFYDGNINKL